MLANQIFTICLQPLCEHGFLSSILCKCSQSGMHLCTFSTTCLSFFFTDLPLLCFTRTGKIMYCSMFLPQFLLRIWMLARFSESSLHIHVPTFSSLDVNYQRWKNAHTHTKGQLQNPWRKCREKISENADCPYEMARKLIKLSNNALLCLFLKDFPGLYYIYNLRHYRLKDYTQALVPSLNTQTISSSDKPF